MNGRNEAFFSFSRFLIDRCRFSIIIMNWKLYLFMPVWKNYIQNLLLSLFIVQSCLILWSHGLHHAKLPCPSLSPRVCSNSCTLSWWCYLIISSSVAPFSSCPQLFSASGSFPVSRLLASGSQSTGALASASVLPMNIQGWFLLGLTGLISLQSKGLSRAFSSTTLQKHQFFGA